MRPHDRRPHDKRSSVRRWAAPLLATAAMTLGACVPSTLAPYTSGPTPDAPRLGAWGDSILEESRTQIEGSLADTWSVSTTASPGATLTQLTVRAQEYMFSAPSAEVVVAGTNDVHEIDGPWGTLDHLRDQSMVLESTRDVPCLVWVNVDESMPPRSAGAEPGPHAADFNTALRLWAARHPHLRIVDWNAALLFLGRDHLIALDGVHPSDEGRQVLANLVRYVLDNDCPPEAKVWRDPPRFGWR